MLRLGKMTDYAIVLMAKISESPGLPHSAARLAEATSLPEPTVAKLLKLLAKGALLISHRGVQGGYTLCRPADQISIADIVTALEGPIAITDCVDAAQGCCAHEHNCSVRGNWNKINSAVREALANVPLTEMAQRQVG